MNRRTFLNTMAGAPLALPLNAARRPNIIVILADDLGFADTGLTGCRDFATPHLDRLARAGNGTAR